MRKANLIFAVFVLTFFGVFSCSVNGQTQNKTKNSNTISKKQKTAKFIIDLKGEDKDGVPHSNIFVSAGDKKIFIMSILGKAEKSGFSKSSVEEYRHMKDRGIPINALEFCHSWYAGSGDYFYIVPSKKGVQIFHGWQEEEQDDAKYHWKKIKEIPFQ